MPPVGYAKRRKELEAQRAATRAAATKKLSAQRSRQAQNSYDTPGRKQTYLNALAEGHTKTDARRLASREVKGRLVPLSEEAVRKWRERDPIFREAEAKNYKAYRQTAAGETVTSYDGSFESFRKVFFGYDTPPHQKLIVNALNKALQSKHRSITLCLLPPEFGKTSCLEDWICEQIAHKPDIRIGIVSATPKHGWKIIGKLKKRLTAEGSPFVMKYGPFYEPDQRHQGKPWAQDHFMVLQRDSDERDYTVSAFGWDGSVIGTRWDILVMDDVQPFKQLSMTEKIIATFRQDIYTRVGIDCPIVIIGNRVGMGDWYEELLRLDIVDDLIEVPAVNDNGESTWPEKWPLADLELTRKIAGEDVWWRNYMQRPRASGKGSFNETLVEAAKDKMQTHLRPDICQGVIIGTDPALDGGCATIAAAYGADWLCFLDMDYSFQVGSVEGIIAIGDEMAVRYHSGVWVIEQNAFQKGLVRDQRLDALASAHNYTIIPHQTGTLKTDPTWGVGTMADSMRRGELRIAWGSDYCRERFTPLCDQLLAWRPDVDTKNLRQDTVMAAWFVHKWWKENRMINSGTADAFRSSRVLPWAPITRLPTRAMAGVA